MNKRRYIKLLSLHVEQQKLELNKQQKRSEKRREKEQAKKRVSMNTIIINTIIGSTFIFQAQMLKKKPVTFRASGESDYSFLAHLPQTLFYKVCSSLHHHQCLNCLYITDIFVVDPCPWIIADSCYGD